MKKGLTIALIAIIMATGKTFAQSSLLATLNQGDGLKIFYGGTALKQAMAAAAHGDNITLSSGQFDAVDIDKAVSLHGAGAEEDSINGTQPTRIIGNFKISIPTDVTARLSIEGIYNQESIDIIGTLNNAIFQKCTFRSINAYSCTSNSLTVIHCNITTSINLFPKSTGRFINSYVVNPRNGNEATGAFEFTNCYLYNASGMSHSVFSNCFLDSEYANDNLVHSNMCRNCVGYGHVFDKVSQMTNTTIESKEEFQAMFKANTFYKLTDTAKEKYVGNDGTEVGLYGGNLPYSMHILSPQITKCNVAAKTTSDGKLSVDIEVKAAE